MFKKSIKKLQKCKHVSWSFMLNGRLNMTFPFLPSFETLYKEVKLEICEKDFLIHFFHYVCVIETDSLAPQLQFNSDSLKTSRADSDGAEC